jgi:hypothetical protein
VAALGVELDPERHVKRPQPGRRKVVGELLDARLVRDGRMRVGAARGRLARVDAALAVHVVQMLGLQVVGLEVLVGDRPRGRYPAVMADLAEVFPAHAEQRRAVEFGVAADVVVGVGVERVAVAVPPHLLCLVFTLHVDGTRVPVVLLARDVVAALEQENALAAGRELPSERAAAGAAADDDHVVVVVGRHEISLVR